MGLHTTASLAYDLLQHLTYESPRRASAAVKLQHCPSIVTAHITADSSKLFVGQQNLSMCDCSAAAFPSHSLTASATASLYVTLCSFSA